MPKQSEIHYKISLAKLLQDKTAPSQELDFTFDFHLDDQRMVENIVIYQHSSSLPQPYATRVVENIYNAFKKAGLQKNPEEQYNAVADPMIGHFNTAPTTRTSVANKIDDAMKNLGARREIILAPPVKRQEEVQPGGQHTARLRKSDLIAEFAKILEEKYPQETNHGAVAGVLADAVYRYRSKTTDNGRS